MLSHETVFVTGVATCVAVSVSGLEGSMQLMVLSVVVLVWLVLISSAISRPKAPAALDNAIAMNPSWDADMDICNEMMRKGSKSFFMASKLLPVWMRLPTLALYAHCRHGDDVVDDEEDENKYVQVLKTLHKRLDEAFDEKVAISSLATPVERTFASVVRAFDVPKELPAALLEGFEWDLEDAVKRYETIDDTVAYGVRVASAVGGMMVALMPKSLRKPEIMARAYDLGIAMQLTNISRDVGEDARNGRCYLPNKWLKEEGVDRDELLRDPKHTPALGRVVERLLDTADMYYARADAGIKFLPADCQLAVQAAGVIYGDIGRIVRKNNCNSVETRAHTSKTRKLYLVLIAFVKKLSCGSITCDAPVAAPAAYLVKAVCTNQNQFSVTPVTKRQFISTSSESVFESVSQLGTRCNAYLEQNSVCVKLQKFNMSLQNSAHMVNSPR
jgi:phytoene synthase